MAKNEMYSTRELELMWMQSDCDTLSEFARVHKLNVNKFKRLATGWRKRKRALRKGKAGSVPLELEARELILGLWWEMVQRLGPCFEPVDESATEIKKLAAIASILKVAHNGLAQLLEMDDDPVMTPISIEGLDVDKL